MAFAIANGNFSSGSTWDTGVSPTGSEDAYANSFTIQVDGTQSLGAVRNDASDYRLPNTATPLMTSATSPSGIVTWTTQTAGSEAYRAFDRNTATLWQTTAGVQSGIITYQFPSTKIIKKYYWRGSATATTTPRNFTFEGSNDGIIFTILNTQTLINVGANGIFTSPVLANTTPYLYYRLNVTATNGGTLQIVEIEMTESTSTIVGQVAGGTFNLNDGSNLTCTSSQGIYIGSTTAVVQFAGGSGTTATLTATLPATIPNTASQVSVLHSNTGSLTINGDITYNTGGVAGRYHIQGTSTGILTINGIVSTTGPGASSGNACILMAGGTLNINGIVSGGGAASGQIISATAGTINITGQVNTSGNANISGGTQVNVIGDINNTGIGAAISSPTATVSVTGAINVNNTGAGVSTTTGGVTVNGPISVLAPNGASNGVASTLGLVKCSGLLFNYNQWQAVFAPKITIEATTSSITYQTFASGNQIMYIGSSGSLGQPTVNNVRFGTVYGPASEFTGTLRVPNPNTVLLGNLTDNTTGTYLPSSPADFVTELNISTVPVAVRLRNCSTVATTGGQIASYNI
jgi:hypothetical protein